MGTLRSSNWVFTSTCWAHNCHKNALIRFRSEDTILVCSTALFLICNWFFFLFYGPCSLFKHQNANQMNDNQRHHHHFHPRKRAERLLLLRTHTYKVEWLILFYLFLLLGSEKTWIKVRMNKSTANEYDRKFQLLIKSPTIRVTCVCVCVCKLRPE